MAKTNRAVDPTFLVFANRLNEHAAYVENRLPATVDPVTVTLSDELHPKVYADWQRRHGDHKAVAEAMAVAELKRAGLAIDPNDEKIGALIALQGQRLLFISHTPPRDQPATLGQLGDVDHKFDREIVWETVVGALVALGDGSRMKSADILNYGLPNGMSRVTNSEVRNAEDSYAQKWSRPMHARNLSIENKVALVEGALWVCGIKARAAGMLWREMGGTTDRRGDRPHTELTNAIYDGSILERHTVALNRAAEWTVPPERLQDAFAWMKRPLLAAQRSKAGAKFDAERAAGNAAPAIAT